MWCFVVLVFFYVIVLYLNCCGFYMIPILIGSFDCLGLRDFGFVFVWSPVVAVSLELFLLGCGLWVAVV